jgi:hypothetical protein
MLSSTKYTPCQQRYRHATPRTPVLFPLMASACGGDQLRRSKKLQRCTSAYTCWPCFMIQAPLSLPRTHACFGTTAKNLLPFPVVNRAGALAAQTRTRYVARTHAPRGDLTRSGARVAPVQSAQLGSTIADHAGRV